MLVDIIITIVVTRTQVEISSKTLHLPKRFGLFVIIILGETIFSLVISFSERGRPTMTVFGRRVGITIAFSLEDLL